MLPKQAPQRDPQEISLLHDAATWDEEEAESSWDDEREGLIAELARSGEGFTGLTST